MKFDERSPEEWRRSAEPPLRRVSGAQVTLGAQTQSGYFAGAGSGATAPLFGCVEQTFLSAGGGTFQFRFRRLAAVAPERRFGAPRRRKSRPNPQAGKPALLFRLRPQQQCERRAKRME